jgi:predicted Zn-dependent peptidase
MKATRRNTALMIFLIAAMALSCTSIARELGKHRLPNGITVITEPAEWNRIVAVSVVVGAGSKHDPPKLKGLASLTNGLLIEGTTTMAPLEMAELLDGSGVRIGTEITDDYAEVHVTAIDRHVDVALEVLADVLVNPAFDAARILEAQGRAHETVEQQMSDPYSRNFHMIAEMLYEGHPYAFLVAGTTDGIDRITRGDVVRFHSKRYVAGNTVVSVVGKFSEKHVVERLGELLSEYPEGSPRDAAFPALAPSDQPKRVLYRDTPESYVAVGFLAPAIGEDDFAPVRVANEILGDGEWSRLGTTLGAPDAAFVNRYGSVVFAGQEHGAVIVYASTDDVKETVRIITGEVERLRTEPVTEDELEVARNRLAGRILIQGQSNLVRAARYGVYELAGLGAEYGDEYLEEVARVDAGDVLEAAQEYLEEPATVIVRPGKPSRKGI